MPSVSFAVPPDLLVVHLGVPVWRAYDTDDAEDARSFHYTLTDIQDAFDVRDLAQQLGQPLDAPATDAARHAPIVVQALDAGLITAPLDPTRPAWADWQTRRAAAQAVGASFVPDCPRCGHRDALLVIAGFFATAARLTPDGFALSDASRCDTDAEVVTCRACAFRFPLAFVTL